MGFFPKGCLSGRSPAAAGRRPNPVIYWPQTPTCRGHNFKHLHFNVGEAGTQRMSDAQFQRDGVSGCRARVFARAVGGAGKLRLCEVGVGGMRASSEKQDQLQLDAPA